MNNNSELKLYLMRHGETVWNVKKKFQGQLNSPLTEKGTAKLEETAEELKNINFQSVYTSKMGRAVESAEIILRKNKRNLESPLKINSMMEFNEIYFGIWQGMTYEEIKKEYPEEYERYFNNPGKYEAWSIGGEDLEEGLERFIKGIEKIISFEKREEGSGNILVVTHGTVLELYLNYLENRKISELDERKLIGNGEYKVIARRN